MSALGAEARQNWPLPEGRRSKGTMCSAVAKKGYSGENQAVAPGRLSIGKVEGGETRAGAWCDGPLLDA